MTRMTGPDCVVMCNLINTHTHTHTHTHTAVVVDRFYRKGKCVHTGTLQVSVDTRRDFFLETKERESETGEAHIIYLP